ncbi:MAG: TetR/AcrR family transcriptional regulator [Reyranella sp.]|uniref:TetR/AcrR family transcriptional regulator n=1 Tax=Reyranella sp. TaxID=1929291 RepID=UPI003D150806
MEGGGRANQRRRTRKDLLQAAGRLMKEGRPPTLEEVAEAALVSRATAYRYFPNVDALLAEATLDMASPDPARLFEGASSSDPVARVVLADEALHDMVAANEPALRLFLASTVQRAARSDGEDGVPLRQNRRTPLIEAALAPTRRQLKPAAYDSLVKALALVLGTEAVIVCKDVLQLSDSEARKVKRWAIKALVEAALR